MTQEEYDLMCDIGGVFEDWNRNGIKKEKIAIQLIRQLIKIYDLEEKEDE